MSFKLQVAGVGKDSQWLDIGLRILFMQSMLLNFYKFMQLHVVLREQFTCLDCDCTSFVARYVSWFHFFYYASIGSYEVCQSSDSVVVSIYLPKRKSHILNRNHMHWVTFTQGYTSFQQIRKLTVQFIKINNNKIKKRKFALW